MPPFAKRLAGISPLGPLFSKELRTTSRRKRTYLLRFLYLLALLVVLLAVSAAYSHEYGYNSVAQKAQRNAEMGMAFFATFCFFSLTAMALIGPVLTATAVNSERLHKTLPVLLMTPITAWQIIAGKLSSRLLIAITLLSLSLPVLAVVRLLGGVETEQVIAAIGLCMVMAILTASISLFLSTLMNRAYVVIILAYAFIGFIWLFVPFCSMLLFEILGIRRGLARGSEAWLIQAAGIWELPVNMFVIAIPEAGRAGFLPWWVSGLFWLAIAALLVLWSSVILRRMARKEQESGGPSTPLLPSTLPTVAAMPPPGPADAATPPPLPDATPPLAATLPYAGPGLSRPERSVSDNPVLWRELRKPLMARKWQAVVSTVVVLSMLVGVYVLLLLTGYRSYTPLADRDTQIVFACIFCGLLNILFCIISATAIAPEKESDTWTLLLATPLQARQIVFGKLMGLARRMMWPSLLIVAHFLLFTIVGILHVVTFVVILWLIFTTNVIWLATGAYFSLRCRNVTLAIVYNLLGPVLLYLVPFALLLIYVGFFDRRSNAPEFVGVYSPYSYFIGIIHELTGSDGQLVDQQVSFPYFQSLSSGEFYLATFLLGVVYLLLTAAVIFFTISGFDRIVGRAAQLEPTTAPSGFDTAPAGA